MSICFVILLLMHSLVDSLPIFPTVSGVSRKTIIGKRVLEERSVGFALYNTYTEHNAVKRHTLAMTYLLC